jgi:hypothetical protein
MIRDVILTAVLVLTSTAAAAAQDIEARVKQVRDGTVRLTFASKPGVCGDGETFISTRGWSERSGRRTIFRDSRDSYSITTGSSDYDWRRCEEGPLRVALDVDNGMVVDVRTYVGASWRGDEDAMRVSSKNAVAYLLGVIEQSDTRAAKRAITPIIMADSVDPYPGLLRIARNENVARDTRKSALFWIGQAAAEEMTKNLKDIVDDPGDIEVRKSAIFALSQQRTTDAVTALMDVVKKNPEKELKKSALFWLSQIDDPRVLSFYEDILLRRN